MIIPDYRGGSIVNLMSSITGATGAGSPSVYPELTLLPAAMLAKRRSIVLIVIDGLGFEYLTTRSGDGPLARSLLGSITSVFPPTTATAIPAFLTGLAPQQHGLTGWFTYFRELGTVLAVLPFRSRHGGAPLGQTGLSPLALTGIRPVFERIPRRCFVLAPDWIAASDFNRAYSAGATVVPYKGAEAFWRMLRGLVDSGDEQSYIYAYWPELDSLAHTFGISSPQVRAHLRELERGFQSLLEGAPAGRCGIIVTADHGFVDTTADRVVTLSDFPDLEATLALPLCGEPRTTYCYLRCGAEGAFFEAVRRRLEHCVRLLPGGQLIDQGVFGLGDPHPRLRERVGDYVLLAKDNYVVKDWTLGESPYLHLGVHGGNSPAEMYVPVVFATP